jgi:predicted metal-dependent peptidase
MQYGFDTPTFRRFHRDCAANDFDTIAPATQRPQPEVGVIRDTSGSMGNFEPGDGLYEATREIEGICKQAGARIQLIDVACAATVKDIREVTSVANLDIRDGGGTDLRLGIEAFRMKKRNRPNIVIMLTDGYTAWPNYKPKEFKLIVCLVGKYKAPKDSIPKWATVIDIDDSGITKKDGQ